jgi:hypothetical protein
LSALRGEVELSLPGGAKAKAVQVVDASQKPLVGASVAVFDPLLGTLAEGTTGAHGLFTIRPCGHCLAVAWTEGFGSRVVQVEDDETIVRLSRLSTVDVQADWAPEGTEVSLRLLHPRRAVVTKGVAHFDNVPASDFLVSLVANDCEFHTRGSVGEQQHVTVVIPRQRSASISVSLADRSGQPVEEASMGIEPLAPGFSGWRTGIVTFGSGERIEASQLPAGPVRLVLSAAGMRDVTREVMLEPGANELDVELEPETALAP